MEKKNSEIEYDEFGDTRNRKGLLEDGYTKHKRGAKEKARINFTKMKREMQSNEDKEKNKKPEPVVKDEKSKKRLLKEIAIDEAEYGNNTEAIPEKKKKKKVPKKGRVRF
jgi:hypothetical protein